MKVLSRKGYTLIELVVVIVIIGLILGLVAPRIQYAFLTDDLRATTCRIMSTVRNLRNEAVRENRSYFFHFDLESNKIWTDYAGMGDEQKRLAQEKSFTLPYGIRIIDIWCRGRGVQSEGEVTVRFSKKGYVDQCAIHLGTEHDEKITLELSPFLGTVTVYDRYVDFRTF